MNAFSEPDIVARAQKGDTAALKALLYGDERYLRYCARVYLEHTPASYHDDLLQVARMGVLRALETYEVEKGKFSTYAFHWVRSLVRRHAIDLSGIVIERNTKASGGRVGRRFSRPAFSLQTPVGDDDGATYQDLMEGRERPLDEQATQAQLRDAIADLEPRDREIITRRGWDGDSLDEIGTDFGVSRERIRQIEKRALKRLRARLAPHVDGAIKSPWGQSIVA